MTDLYSGSGFSDPQSSNIRKAHKFSRKSELSEAQSAIERLNRLNESDQSTAQHVVDQLLFNSADFRLIAGDLTKNPDVWWFDPGEHSQVWRMFPSDRAAQNAIYESWDIVQAQLPPSLVQAIESKILQHAQKTERIDTFNKPRNAVFFSNGVFDWDEGGFRGALASPIDLVSFGSSEALRLTHHRKHNNQKTA